MMRHILFAICPYIWCFAAGAQTLPTVPVPAENPITEEKRVLGKILFWDEQLSSDNLTACGTCHIPGAGGGEPRFGMNPGSDLTFATPDDVFGSPGVPRSDDMGNYVVDAIYGTDAQVTGRTANVVVNAAYATDLFWDGRATSQFTDPQTGVVEIAGGGALESQAVGPPLSDVEMAHSDRDWSMISAKLENARPLALASDIPGDMVAALSADATYPELFEQAFGTTEINATRIAFAIATYQRTLISDQSPWDLWIQGDNTALTSQQIQGWNAFQASACAICHIPPLFTNNAFHNIGVRPDAEDLGRGAITGFAPDNGRFKTPTLRNTGLRFSFMHNGAFFNMQQVLAFYAQPAGPGVPNIDRLMPVNLPLPQRAAIDDFITNGLTDPRVANETFPFDRPTLNSERPTNPAIIGVGTPDGLGEVPRMVSHNPPLAGSPDFRLGVTNIAEGASVNLLVSSSPPVAGVLTPDETLGPFTASSGDGVAPVATAFWTVPDDASLDGVPMYFQWFVPDTGARSRIAEATIFCGTGGCSEPCLADTNGDGELNPADFNAWILALNAQSPACDQNGDGLCNPGDFNAWILNFNAGC
ncbi:MAG: cytochrome c peroxidase [Planctomycetota bacterium]